MTMDIKSFYRLFVGTKVEQILNTHRETSIGYIKYVNLTITLQTAIRSCIELVLFSISFTEEDIKHLVTSTGGKKHKTSNELDSNETFTT